MIDVSQMAALPLEEKRDLLKALLSLEAGGSRGVIPLSYGQQSLWFIHQLAPTSPAYNFLYAARIRASLDVEIFRRACRILVERHPLLHARFVIQDHKPRMLVDKAFLLDIPLADASKWNEEVLLEVLRQRADVPFTLERAPCLRIELYQRSEAETILLLVFPHIIADLWSADLLLQELQQIYATLCTGRKLALPPVTTQFGDFIRWQMAQTHGESGQKSRHYWHNLLAGELPVLDLPARIQRPPVQTYNGAAHSWELRPEVVQQVRGMAKEHSATPFMVLLAIFQLLLHRLSGQEDILVGTAVAGRDRPEWEKVVGYFLNQVVFRTQFTAQRSFRHLLEESRNQVYQALEHQAYPFGLLVKQLHPRRDPARTPIFQVMFIWDKPRELEDAETRADDQRLPFDTLLMEQRGAPFDLTLIVFEIGDKLTCCFRYNSDLFDANTIKRWAACFDVLLESSVTGPDKLVTELPILPPTERQRILVDWNRTKTPVIHSSFLELFEKQVETIPDGVAVCFENVNLSYDKLNRRANQLARYLQSHGINRGSVVALSLPRGIEMIVAILAVWKSGAAYAYLDPQYPPKRRHDVLEEVRPDLTLDNGLPDIERQSDSNLGLSLFPDDWAYLIYTSGSTGQAKGTILRHGGLINLALAEQRALGLKSSDRILQFASLSFDASVWEIVGTLGAGATLVLGNQTDLLPGRPLWQFLNDQTISCVTLPPSILAMLPLEPLPSLRTLVVAGEACSAELASSWASGRRFFNAYGPTEVTVCATIAECVDPTRIPPSIGKPIANTRAYVLDPNLEPVPVGVRGELYIAGSGVAFGYFNKPDLTVERFLPNPFEQADDGVIYRTGDVVRWTAQGELEFLGRIDDQVKIRGCRIELEEIQGVLRRHPEVKDAVVIVRKDQKETLSLVAYVVPRSAAAFSLPNLQSYLRDHLPSTMLPAAIVHLEAFPLNSTGKVDRARLPAPSFALNGTGHIANLSVNGKPERTPLERLLVQIWSRVLMQDSVDLHENFFDLGGASTQTLEVVALAREQGISLAPDMLFRYPTIAELASALSGRDRQENKETSEAIPLATASVASSLSVTPAPCLTATVGSVVESLGYYLPNQRVTTEQLLRGCRNKVDFPLERLTGIHSRRVAGETEFSIDLAVKAVADCLRHSACLPRDFDLVICCNISRYDGPQYQFSLEPATAARICQRFDMVNAVSLDITNACAGTFTAILIIDTFIRQGIIRRGMVVSGEYISHLSLTAQQEITNFMDSRLACLTLGDSGVAFILEQAPDAKVGFQDIELYTLGKYHDLCVAKLSSGIGPIMHTDAVTGTTVTIKQAVSHAVEVLRRKNWDLDKVDALIIHQTSETTLDGAMREINRAVGKPFCHRGNTIYNVAERGNTATNTHFLAVAEKIQAGEFKAGDHTIFAVSGSGQTVGTALYIFDDLPERLREQGTKPSVVNSLNGTELTSPLRHFPCQRRMRIESIGTLDRAANSNPDTLTMLRQAGEACLERWPRPRHEIDLVIHTGVHRTDFLTEPAIAAIAAGHLAINHDENLRGNKRTLAFDILNSAGGTLTACFIASGLMWAQKFSRTLLLASEVDPNRQFWPENPIGLEETASALVLEESPNTEGFAAFAYRAFPEYVEAIVSSTGVRYNAPAVFARRDPGLDTILVKCVDETVKEFLSRQSLTLEDVGMVVPPQCPGNLGALLAEILGLGPERLLNLQPSRDYYTSSLAYAFQKLRQDNQLATKMPILIIEIAAGLQVWSALYYP